jgi:hypothetical protein
MSQARPAHRSFLAASVLTVSILTVVLWAVGRACSDRYGWSQWLLWLPTPVALVAAGLGAPAIVRFMAASARRRIALAAWLVIAAAVATHFVLHEHHLFRSAPAAGDGLRIAHWSMGHGKRGREAENARAIIDLHADLTILNEAGRRTRRGVALCRAHAPAHRRAAPARGCR